MNRSNFIKQMNTSVMKPYETEPLLEVEVKQWEMTEAIKKLKQDQPEQFVRSKQYILFMKQFEGLLKEKLQHKRPTELDMELLICMYNLFLTLCE